MTDTPQSSFIGADIPDEAKYYDPDRDEKYWQAVKAANKKLGQQQQLIAFKENQMRSQGLGLQVESVVRARLTLLIEHLMPSEPINVPEDGEGGDFGNLDRIEFEIKWNEQMMEAQDASIAAHNRAVLLQGVPGQNGLQPGQPVDLSQEILRRREERKQLQQVADAIEQTLTDEDDAT